MSFFHPFCSWLSIIFVHSSQFFCEYLCYFEISFSLCIACTLVLLFNFDFSSLLVLCFFWMCSECVIHSFSKVKRRWIKGRGKETVCKIFFRGIRINAFKFNIGIQSFVTILHSCEVLTLILLVHMFSFAIRFEQESTLFIWCPQLALYI